MRTLQSTYWLEPAGSHGVWGLDDYHFLPFLFGSAQLRGMYSYYSWDYLLLICSSPGHKHLRPKSIHDNEVVEEFSKDYIYFACIRFINSVRDGPVLPQSPSVIDVRHRLKQRRCDGTRQCWTTFRLYVHFVLERLGGSETEILTEGKNMGQGQSGNDQDVSRRGAGEAASNAALPVWINSGLRGIGRAASGGCPRRRALWPHAFTRRCVRSTCRMA